MMRRLSALLVFALASASALSACGGGGPLAVEEVVMSASEGGPGATTFSPSDHTIYSEVRLNRVETGLTVKLVWTAVDTSAGQDIEVATKDFTSLAANTINAQVELPNDWPTGSYKLDIYLNGTLAKTADYSVQ
jgi:ABC-type glycerol-3-phosphate transport system substrate-binding protein